MIDCKINQINFVPLATNWFSARGEGGDYQNIATSILRLLWLSHSSAAWNIYTWIKYTWYSLTLKKQCKIASISWNKGILINHSVHASLVSCTWDKRDRGFSTEKKEWTRDRQTIDKTWIKLWWEAATASDVQTERFVLRFCIQFVFRKKHKGV